MSEYLRDLKNMKPGEKHPPINLGPYDSPTLWNTLDPYGADRPHQRRPMEISWDVMEENDVPVTRRSHCMHRTIPYARCLKYMNPLTPWTSNCFEFEEAEAECRAFEGYRSMLLKQRFMEITKDYTLADKFFAPDKAPMRKEWKFWNIFYHRAATARLSGWDESDPQNPLFDCEPNRADMRAGISPNWTERQMIKQPWGGVSWTPPEVVNKEMPRNQFPLAEENKPQNQK